MIWRLAALAIAVLCFVLGVLYLTIWDYPMLAFGFFLAAGGYVFVFFNEREHWQNRNARR